MVEYAGGDRGNKVPFSQLEESSRDGSSIEKAVVISGAANSMEGISAEYQYLSDNYGKKGVDWNLQLQSLAQDKGKSYDVMMIELKDGTELSVYFEKSEFFGK